MEPLESMIAIVIIALVRSRRNPRETLPRSQEPGDGPHHAGFPDTQKSRLAAVDWSILRNRSPYPGSNQ